MSRHKKKKRKRKKTKNNKPLGRQHQKRALLRAEQKEKPRRRLLAW